MAANRLGPRLKADRLQAGLSQTELASRASTHGSTISRIERGVRLAVRSDARDVLISLAQALNQDPRDYLQLAGHAVDEPEETFAEVLQRFETLTQKQREALLEMYTAFTR